MSAESGFFRLASINNAKGGLLPALKHNKRELPERGHIDPSRTVLNYSLTPTQTAEEIQRSVKKILIDNG